MTTAARFLLAGVAAAAVAWMVSRGGSPPRAPTGSPRSLPDASDDSPLSAPDGLQAERREVAPPPEGGLAEPSLESKDEAIEPSEIEDEELAAKVQKAFRESRRAHELDELAFPESSPKITRDNAKLLAKHFDRLKQDIHRNSSEFMDFLEQQYLENPGVAVRAESIDEWKRKIEERFPGYPEGYTFFQFQEDGEHVLAAWKVGEDPEVSNFESANAVFWTQYVRLERQKFLRYFTFE